MRRAADQPLAGEWEYPGGKFEDGEDGPICLHRELFEELGIDAQICVPVIHNIAEKIIEAISDGTDD